MMFTSTEASANKAQGHAALVPQHGLHEQLQLRLDGGQAQGGPETAPLRCGYMGENSCNIRARQVQGDATQHDAFVHDLHSDRGVLSTQYPTQQLDRSAVYLSALHRLVDRKSPQPPLISRAGRGDLQSIKRRNPQCSLRVLQPPPIWAAYL